MSERVHRTYWFARSDDLLQREGSTSHVILFTLTAVVGVLGFIVIGLGVAEFIAGSWLLGSFVVVLGLVELLITLGLLVTALGDMADRLLNNRLLDANPDATIADLRAARKA